MDYFKKACIKDYTAWDLNCSCVKKDKKLEKKFKRSARRKLKIGLDKLKSL